MRLKQVFAGTSQKKKAAPTVSFCYFNGAIRFNKSTAEILGLKKGDSLVFFQNEDDPTDWYFKKSAAGGSIQLKAQGNILYVYCASIARVLLESRESREIRVSAQFYLSDAQQICGCGSGYWKILPDIIK